MVQSSTTLRRQAERKEGRKGGNQMANNEGRKEGTRKKGDRWAGRQA
jgi:hypothetical protein